MLGTGALRDVTLRPWPQSKKAELTAEDLAVQISQLAEERGGHLREITENSLQDELLAGNNVADNATSDIEEKAKKEAPSREQRQEDILREGKQIYQHLEYVPQNYILRLSANQNQVGQI